MLENGKRPKIAVFVDGVNYAYQIPMFSQEMRNQFEKSQFPLDEPLFQASFGIFRFMNYLRRKGHSNQLKAHLLRRYGDLEYAPSLPTDLDKVKESYLQTKKQIDAIAKSYGVKTLFVWQPTRLFHCSTEKYRTPIPAKMAAIHDVNYLYLGDLCSKLDSAERYFVDGIHYSPRLNEQIAKNVLRVLLAWPK
jgi:hypothetical protein